MEDPPRDPDAAAIIPNLPARTGRMLALPPPPPTTAAELSTPPPPPPPLPPPNLPPHACDPPPFAEPLGPSVPLAARFAAASRMLARARETEGARRSSSGASDGSGESEPLAPTSYRLVYDSLLPPPSKAETTTTSTRWEYAPGLRSWCVPDNEDEANDANDPPPLVFESRFESGNLRRAVRVGPREYDLVLQPDLNTSLHAQWYFFAVRNGRCAGKKGGEGAPDAANAATKTKTNNYRLNIINLLKPDSLYNSGLRPLVHSAARQRRDGIGWHRAGEGVAYHATPARAAAEGDDEDGGADPTTKKRRAATTTKNNNRRHFTLTFEYAFEEDDDLVHFAHCYPYTYTDLQRELHALLRREALAAPRLSPSPAVLCSRETLCTTLAGNACDLLTITGPLDQGLPLHARLGVVLSARVHPGETNASWMMRGALRELLFSPSPSSSPAAAAASAAAQQNDLRSLLLGRFVFKVAPMLNPDGVACGNYRCSLAGVDLNRVYASPCDRAHPTVAAFKKVVAAFADERPVVLLADLHGHSRKLGVFAYGCDPDEARKLGFSTETTEQQQQQHHQPGSRGTVPGVPRRHQARLFPLLLHAAAPDLFSFAACSFRVARSKAGTGRMVAFAELGLANALTIEASFCGPLAPVLVAAEGGGGEGDGGSGGSSTTASPPPRLRRVHFNTSHLERMGQVIVRALLDYVPAEAGVVGATAAVAASAEEAAATAEAALPPPPQQQQPPPPAPSSVRQQMLQQLEVLAEAESAAAQLSGGKAGQRPARPAAAVAAAGAADDADNGPSTSGGVRLVQTRRGPVLEVVAAGRDEEEIDALEDEEEEDDQPCTDSEDEDGGGRGGRGNGGRSSSSSGGEGGGGGRRRGRKQACRQQSPAAQRRAALERMRERRRQLVEALGTAVAGRVLEGGSGAEDEGEDDDGALTAAPAPAPAAAAAATGSTAALQLLLAASSTAATSSSSSSSSSPLLLLGELAAFFAASRAAAVAAAAGGGGNGDSTSALGLLELAAVARPALLRMGRGVETEGDGGGGAGGAATAVEADAHAAATATTAAVAAVTAVRRAATAAAAELVARAPTSKRGKPATPSNSAEAPPSGVAKKKTKKRNNKHRGGAKQRLKREERALAAAVAEATAAAADPVLLQERARAEAGLAVALQKRG